MGQLQQYLKKNGCYSEETKPNEESLKLKKYHQTCASDLLHWWSTQNLREGHLEAQMRNEDLELGNGTGSGTNGEHGLVSELTRDVRNVEAE